MNNKFTLHINDLEQEYSDRFDSQFCEEISIHKLVNLILDSNQEKTTWDGKIAFEKKDLDTYYYVLKNGWKIDKLEELIIN